jgi:hypothetical protein
VDRLTYALLVCEQRHTTQPRINLSCGSSLNLGPVANGGRSFVIAQAPWPQSGSAASPVRARYLGERTGFMLADQCMRRALTSTVELRELGHTSQTVAVLSTVPAALASCVAGR